MARCRGRGPSPRRGQGRRRRLGADRRLGRGPAGRGDRRDRARLRPRLQPDPGPADQPAAEPRARARDRQAGHPPLPLGGRPARRAGRAASTELRAAGVGGPAWASGVRGAAAGRHPLVLGSARLRPRRSSTSASPSASRGSSSGAARRRRPTRSPLVPADRLLVETDSPFLAPPGAPRSRNEPEWVRVTGAWAAERRGTTLDALGARPRRRLRPDLPESPEDRMTHATRRSLLVASVAALALVVAACGVEPSEPRLRRPPPARPRPPRSRRPRPPSVARDHPELRPRPRRRRPPAPSRRRPAASRRTG